MIELLKLKEIYDLTSVPDVDLMELSDDLIRTRGNKYKFIQHHFHYDLRKLFNFSNQAISIWNSFNVVSADTPNTFKTI